MSLVLISAFFFSFSTIQCVQSNLFIILLKSSQILTSLGEFTLFHALSNIPVDKSTLGVHQIELVIQTSPGLGNGSGVGQHAHSSLHLGQISTRHHSWRLVVDAHLEASGTPVHKLDGALGLHGGDCRIHILGDDISTVQHAASHVLAVTRVTLHHLVGRLKAGVGDLGHSQLLVVGSHGGDDGRVGHQREVDAREWDQVGLELCHVHIEGPIKAKGGSDGGHNLPYEAVEVGVGGSLDPQIAVADVVGGLVVHHEDAVGVLQGGVRGEDGVVGLNNSRGHLRGRVDGKLQLRLFPVVHAEVLHEERGKAGASASTEGVVDDEALEAFALLSQLVDPLLHLGNELSADGVLATGIVIGRVFLAGDQLVRMEEITVFTSSNFIYNGIKSAIFREFFLSLPITVGSKST